MTSNQLTLKAWKSMKNDKNIIKKITIAIGGKDVEVTPTELEHLYDALSALLCATDHRPRVVEKHVYHDWHWKQWQPTWIGGDTSGSYLTSTNSAAIAVS